MLNISNAAVPEVGATFKTPWEGGVLILTVRSDIYGVVSLIC